MEINKPDSFSFLFKCLRHVRHFVWRVFSSHAPNILRIMFENLHLSLPGLRVEMQMPRCRFPRMNRKSNARGSAQAPTSSWKGSRRCRLCYLCVWQCSGAACNSLVCNKFIDNMRFSIVTGRWCDGIFYGWQTAETQHFTIAALC